MNHPIRRRKYQQGFTLLETGIAVMLMSLILMGTMDLFMNASRSSLRANSEASAGQDSANAMQRVIDKTREARSMLLPSEGTIDGPSGTTAASFQTTMVNGEVINAALELNMPATTSITVKNGAGASLALTQYDRTATATHALFYRGNSGTDSTPNPATGKALWEYDSPAGTSTVLCKSIDAGTPNAVQFVRPLSAQVNGAAATSTQIEAKLVSGYSSMLANGQQSVQTNEATGGSNTTTLTGKCVLMRNHGSDPAPSTASQQVSDHAFQPM